jgi:DNA-binding protein HU-beta
MNGTELIATIAGRTGFDKAQVKHVLDTYTAVCREQMIGAGEIRIQHFGTLSTAVRKAGDGRNPVTGEKIKVPERRRVKFTPSSKFKEELNPQPAARRRRA